MNVQRSLVALTLPSMDSPPPTKSLKLIAALGVLNMMLFLIEVKAALHWPTALLCFSKMPISRKTFFWIVVYIGKFSAVAS